MINFEDFEFIVTENCVFDKNDTVFNIDKWKVNSPNNILYITGLSGSGKTTLAEKYEKDHKAYMFEIDGIQHGYDSSNLGILSLAEEKFPRYLELRKLIKSGKMSRKDIVSAQDEAISQYIKVFHFVLSEMKNKKDKLFIVEGVQLFQWLPIDSFKGKPLIIKGTSVMTSMSRAMKRSGNGKIDWIAELKNSFPQFVKMYIHHSRGISELKKCVK